MNLRRYDGPLARYPDSSTNEACSLFNTSNFILLNKPNIVYPPPSITPDENVNALLHSLVESNRQQNALLSEAKRRAQQAQVHSAILLRNKTDSSHVLDAILEFLGRIGKPATDEDVKSVDTTLKYAYKCIQEHDRCTDELRTYQNGEETRDQKGTPLSADVVDSLQRAAVTIGQILDCPFSNPVECTLHK